MNGLRSGLHGLKKSLDDIKTRILSFRTHLGILQLVTTNTGGIGISQSDEWVKWVQWTRWKNQEKENVETDEVKVSTEGNSGRNYSIFSMRKKFDFGTKIFSAQGIRIKRDVTEKLRREKEECSTGILNLKSVKKYLERHAIV